MKIISFSLLVVLISITRSWSNNNMQDSSQTFPKLLAEKVYLHIDRISYTSGDDIWFKAYVIDPSTNRLSLNTNKLYVELIATDSKIIQRRTVRIENGTGHGDFQLHDSVPSGRYRIRSYTNYMRNFDEQFFFLKEITVISPYDEIMALNKTIKKIDNEIDIKFFPEGGSLIDNVISRIAFKAVNALGKGCDVAVTLYTPAGEKIATFNSTHKGMGYFNIQPGPDNKYYMVVQSGDSTETRAALPESFTTGVVLRTLVNKDKNLILTISTNEATLPTLKGQDLSVNISSMNLINKLSKIRINSLVNNLLIPLDSIPDGILRITLSGPEGLPLCERLVFLQKNADVKLNISADKNIYKPREKITAEISLSGDSTFTGAGEFSFSAAEERFTDNSSPYPSSIASWFLLESDIRGTIEEPSYYFDTDNKNRLQDLDLLLMTQGWRDFQWKYDNTNFYPPEYGFKVSGRLRKLTVNKPLADSRVNIGIFDRKGSLITSTETDSSGRFRMEDIDLTGEAKLVVTAVNEKGNPQNCMVLLDSLKYVPAEVNDNFSRIKIVPEKSITSYKQEYEIKEAVRKKYRLSDTISLGEVSIIGEKKVDFQTQKVENIRMLYDKPDNEVIVTAKYSGYMNVFEVLKGRVAGVNVTGNTIRIRGTNSIYGKNTPLILVDGVDMSSGRLFPLESLFTLPLGTIDRIDVLKSAGETGAYGVRGANGVISIITKTGDAIPLSKPENHSLTAKMSGYDEARIFYSPQHSSSPVTAFEPDLRTTLFWEPDIRLQSDKSLSVKYFNADNSTKIKVTVEGITTTGIPITASTEYEIR